MDLLEYISDIREYDVPYHSRVCIDLNIRAAKWFKTLSLQLFLISPTSSFLKVQNIV